MPGQKPSAAPDDLGRAIGDAVAAIADRARSDERERCAKIAEAAGAIQVDDEALRCFADDIAADIRGAA